MHARKSCLDRCSSCHSTKHSIRLMRDKTFMILLIDSVCHSARMMNGVFSFTIHSILLLSTTISRRLESVISMNINLFPVHQELSFLIVVILPEMK